MATAHVLGSILPVSSIKLGRLLLNAERPEQDFIDPLDSLPAEAEIIRNDQPCFQETLRLSKSPKLPPYLADIFSVYISRADSTALTATLTGPGAISYDLANPAAWFTNACSQPSTRQFLEDASDNDDDVYLVVGFRTVHDARLAKGVTWTEARRVVDEAPCYFKNSEIAPGMGDGRQLMYKTPGEQVFVVLYYKVQFKWLSSRYINSMTLEENNRWVSAWCWHGPVQEYEQEEEDDVLEARLTDLRDEDISDEEEDTCEDLIGGLAGRPSDLMDIDQDFAYIQGKKENSIKRKWGQGSANDEISKRLKFSSTAV